MRRDGRPGWYEVWYVTVAGLFWLRYTILGVTYRDPDGTPLYCYHTERARLRGPRVDADASFEYAARAKLPGWTISV